jgi:pyrroline-5-carboxylate reductase
VRDSYDYGVLGVGEIGTAIVAGLCDGADASAGENAAPSTLLSPRNAERAAALAARFPTADVAPDNQSVIDRSSVVILAVRPRDAAAILPGLRFRPDQAIISVMAGVPHSELEPLVAPARDIARTIPLPPVSRRAGSTPVYPGTEAAVALFSRLGEAVAVKDASQFEALSAASGTVAAYLRYLGTITGWLSDRGIAPGQAERYVRSIFADVGEDLASATGDLDAIAKAHATPGGINERFAGMLDAGGVYDTAGQSLQAIYDGLRNGRN